MQPFTAKTPLVPKQVLLPQGTDPSLTQSLESSMIQTRQCCHTRDQSHRIAGNRVLLPTLSPEKTDMISNAFESTLQKLVQMMGACKLTLLIRSFSAKSGESSIPPSSTVPFDLRGTHLFRTILPAEDNCSTDSFSAPSGFFASTSTILISSTQSSSFLCQESPITDMFTQFASLRDSLVLAVDYLSFSWRPTSRFASLHDRVRAGRSELLSFNLAVTCNCPQSCGSMSSARIAPPCFTRLRFQLRLSSRDSQDFAKRVRPT